MSMGATNIISLISLVIIQVNSAFAAAAPPGENNPGSQATLIVRAQERLGVTIPRHITGKFCEHLGANIYNGMDAQILKNPTFADFPFWTGQMNPDGITTFYYDRDQINRELRRRAARGGWPESEIDPLFEARTDGLACFWMREGAKNAVQVSPDTGPEGGRVQRIELQAAGQGIAQWTLLPLHRVRKYEFELFARSPNVKALTVSLRLPKAPTPLAQAVISGLARPWHKFTGTLELPEGAPVDAAYKLVVAANEGGQIVIGRVLLWPADHIGGADPDIVRLLKESRLPLLRWPGGNFVSTYHWQDGVGPLEKRPTLPNFAWGGLEPNLFGTDEFIAFCRAAGCEPMICINAGTGSPAEAARWIEYCNGPVSSPMGAWRAANGHPEPYAVHHWEVGNELWGRWQAHWTTAAGYADRYADYVPVMLAADPTIKLYACGAPVMWGKAWNDILIAGTAPILRSITDHPLVGGEVSPRVDPLDVYRDFMGVPQVLEKKWAELQKDMARAGINNPRLAVTELQLFARIGPRANTNEPVRLFPENLVNPGTQAEALYDVLLYHAAVRLAPFVEMITHSATVNHGGGLRKERERVYANPCYYAQVMFADFAEATPVAIQLNAAMERAPLVLPELKNATAECSYPAVDALAAVAQDGSLVISLVHRGTAGPVMIEVKLDGFTAANQAALWSLSATAPWAANTLNAPETVIPKVTSIDVRAGNFKLEIAPYTVLRVRLPKKG